MLMFFYKILIIYITNCGHRNLQNRDTIEKAVYICATVIL